MSLVILEFEKIIWFVICLSYGLGMDHGNDGRNS